MREQPPIATRESWKVRESSGPFSVLPYDQEFSTHEFQQICRGLIPSEMEDKWFIYFEEPWLHLHRSWTGELVFRVRFELASDRVRA